MIRWKRWGFDGVPVLFANSFPKSGTHLLTQVLQGFSQIGPAVDSGLPAVVTFRGNSGIQRPEWEILADLERYLPGDMGYGHLHATSSIINILTQEKFAPFFIIRDPRDVVVSHVHYVTEIEPNHIHHRYYVEKLHSFEERLRTSILGRLSPADELVEASDADSTFSFPDIAARFQPYLDWCQSQAVMTVRYEDFLNDQTGTLQNIVNYAQKRGFPLSVSPENAIRTLQAHLDPKRSPTYRSGKSGGWRDVFSPQNKALFKEVAGELTITLGYEKDFNW
jgi:sulfotransferase 6B1